MGLRPCQHGILGSSVLVSAFGPTRSQSDAANSSTFSSNPNLQRHQERVTVTSRQHNSGKHLYWTHIPVIHPLEEGSEVEAGSGMSEAPRNHKQSEPLTVEASHESDMPAQIVQAFQYSHPLYTCRLVLLN